MAKRYLPLVLVGAFLRLSFGFAGEAQASTRCANATAHGYRVVGVVIYRGATCSAAREVVLRAQDGTAHYRGVWWTCLEQGGRIVCRGSLSGNSGTWGYGLFTVRDVYPVE